VPDGEPETAVVPEPPRREADRGTGAGGDTAVPAECGDDGPASSAGDTAPGEGEGAPGPDSPDDTASPDTGAAPAGDTVPEACSQAAQLLDELAAAASRAASVLRDGQVAAALPAIEEISGTAAQARRLARSAASGRKAGGGQAQLTSDHPRRYKAAQAAQSYLAA
jgi:hypothetical protein